MTNRPLFIAGIMLLLCCCGVGCARGLGPRTTARAQAAPTAQVQTGRATAVAPKPSQTRPSGWPIDHPNRRVTSRFGARRSTSRRHKGIDISAPLGTPVRCTADGLVVVSDQDGLYGHRVEIDHGNGITTVYAHLKERKADVGKRLRCGQVVGLLGRSGNATGPHLHYEVRVNGTPVNPEPYLP